MATTFDEEKLKNILKSALVEAPEEHRNLVQDIIEEAMEDFALARAIEQGLASESVSRDEVFAILEDAQIKLSLGRALPKTSKALKTKVY